MNNDITKIMGVLDHHPDIRLAILFGSIASGTSRSNSDLDLGVARDKPFTAAEKMALIEELAHATARPVDLVDLSTATGPILAQILRHGNRLRNTDRTLYAKLILRMLYHHADMMPIYNRILQHRREKFIHG